MLRKVGYQRNLGCLILIKIFYLTSNQIKYQKWLFDAQVSVSAQSRLSNNVEKWK